MHNSSSLKKENNSNDPSKKRKATHQAQDEPAKKPKMQEHKEDSAHKPQKSALGQATLRPAAHARFKGIEPTNTVHKAANGPSMTPKKLEKDISANVLGKRKRGKFEVYNDGDDQEVSTMPKSPDSTISDNGSLI